MFAYSSEAVSEFVIRRHHLSSLTQGSAADDVVKIVRDVGGLHAQDSESPYLALWNRIRGFKRDWLDSMLFTKKKLVIFHLMRVTLHVVASSEFPMYFQATRDALRKFLRVRSLSYSPKLTKVHQTILELIRDKGKATITDVKEHLKAVGLSTNNLHRIVHYELAGAGIIIRSGRQANKWEWSLTSEWLPQLSLTEFSEEEAKEFLVAKYLKSFGPSTVKDITSWTWHTVRETKSILNKLHEQQRIVKVKIPKRQKTFWMCSEDIDELEAVEAELKARGMNEMQPKVLPEFDPLTVGMRKRWRDLILVPGFRPKLRPHPAPGVILVNGKIFGRYATWPYWRLFFNERVTDAKTIRTMLSEVESQMVFKRVQKLCVGEIDGKHVSSNELKPLIRYFNEAGFYFSDELLCKRIGI